MNEQRAWDDGWEREVFVPINEEQLVTCPTERKGEKGGKDREGGRMGRVEGEGRGREKRRKGMGKDEERGTGEGRERGEG